MAEGLKKLLEKLTKNYMENKRNRLIAVIGASRPTKGYSSSMGRLVGYKLRESIKKDDMIVTGGVRGVGLDVYRGVINYCKERKISDDQFMLIYPEILIWPPLEYFDYAREINKGLEIRIEGEDMLERREKLAEICDCAVVLNGGWGTLDEVWLFLLKKKPVFGLGYSGGAASYIKKLHDGKHVNNFENIDALIQEVKKMN